MRTVELRDGEPEQPPVLGDGDASAGVRPVHTLRWWLFGVAALVVVALVSIQGVIAARERADVARLAAVDGVVPVIDHALTAGPLRPVSEAQAAEEQGGVLARNLTGR